MFKMTAERYANALYEIAVDTEDFDLVKVDLQQIKSIFKALPELEKYCLDAETSLTDSFTVIETAFLKYLKSAKTANTLKVMAENMRLSSLPFLSEAFLVICAEKDNRIMVSAEFANPPDKETIKLIQEKLKVKTGKTVELSTQISPDILGGFRLIWHNRLIDNSIRVRLKQLKRAVAG